MNRFFHIFGLAVFVSLLLIMIVGLDAGAFLAAGVVFFAATILFRRRGLPLWVFAAAAAFCFAPLCFLLTGQAQADSEEGLAGSVRTVRGTVIDRTITEKTTTLTIQLEKQPDNKGLAGKRLLLRTLPGVDVDCGDVVECTVRLLADPDRRLSLYADGIRFEAYSYSEPVYCGQNTKNLAAYFALYREQLRENLVRILPRGEGEVLAAMLTGKTEQIPRPLRESYARSGVSHLLAVSGLHLSVIAAMLEAILAAFSVARRKRAAAQIAAVLLFMALTGFSYSVVRAGVMLILCGLALFLGRDTDTLNTLGAAVTLLLLFNPYAALDIGLQLSYFATMGIAAFATPFSDLGKHLLCGKREAGSVLCACIEAGGVTCSASILTLPLLSWYFGQLSLVTIPVNMIIFPFASIAVGMGMLCALLSMLPLLALPAQAIGLLAGLAVKVINGVAVFFGSLRFAAVSAKSGWVQIWIVAVLGGFLLLWYLRTNWRLRVFAGGLAVCSFLTGALSMSFFWKDTMRVAAVENGEAVALIYGRQAVLIGVPGSDYERRGLAAFLEDWKIQSLCFVVTRTENETEQNAAVDFLDQFPAERQLVLARDGAFQAQLFNCVEISADSRESKEIQMEAAGLQIVKSYVMQPVAADLLLNGRNEWVTAPDLRLPIEGRYYNANVIALSLESARGEAIE